MTEDLSRRRLFGLVGATAAGAAGLAVSGCSAGSDGQPAPQAGDVSRGYVSRPDLTPPAVTVTRHGAGADSRYVFVAAPYSAPGHGGALILDSGGEVVWFGPSTLSQHKLELNTQTYRGQPVLTWFQGLVVKGYGQGELVIADSSYRRIQTIRAVDGVMADFHEFVITPQGTALVTAYRKHAGADLSGVGGPSSGVLLSGVAQEIDIATGRLLFEWDIINHVRVSETYQQRQRHGDGGDGTRSRPFNYFHINSLALDMDGDLLISSRNTWTVYKGQARPCRHRGLADERQEVGLHDGARDRFFWQHDVRPHGDGVLTVFDNGAAGRGEAIPGAHPRCGHQGHARDAQEGLRAPREADGRRGDGQRPVAC